MKSFMKSILVALFVIIAFVAVSMFSGCSTLERAIDENPETTKAAVYVGTLKYIGENSDKAQRVENTASEILSGLSGGTTIDQLDRSEEHTSELQSRGHLVCRLLLEKKKQNK